MNIINNIHDSWKPVMGMLYQEPLNTLRNEVLLNCSYQPQPENIFRIFEKDVKDIRAVILGQDPYPTPGNAIGRAFAINKDVRPPVSLKNIIREVINGGCLNCDENHKQELIENIFVQHPQYQTLEHWDKQGVFLLNTALTVETGKAGSHLSYWKPFIQRVINYISIENPCIWLLWGRKAQAFLPYIEDQMIMDNHNDATIEYVPASGIENYIFTAPHPAAEAYAGGKAGFFGCNHFKYVNKVLEANKKETINW